MKALHLNHLAALLLTVLAPVAGAACKNPIFHHQSRDASTILGLENEWNAAFQSGDTESMGCLLTANFTEIMRNGSVLHRDDELAMAVKNGGHPKAAPILPQITVLLQGNVAVAYGLASERQIHGVLQKNYYADYYVWNGGSWHAFFAQWTPVSEPAE